MKVGKIVIFDKALVSSLVCGALAMCTMSVAIAFGNIRLAKNKIIGWQESRLSNHLTISFFRHVKMVCFQFIFAVVYLSIALGGNMLLT